MTIYVDNMRAPFGRMLLSHMIATTDDELHSMADRIGVARRWHQAPPKVRFSHYDIAVAKRILAIRYGAVPITVLQCSAMCWRRQETGDLGDPADAVEWLRAWRRQMKGERAS